MIQHDKQRGSLPNMTEGEIWDQRSLRARGWVREGDKGLGLGVWGTYQGIVSSFLLKTTLPRNNRFCGKGRDEHRDNERLKMQPTHRQQRE